MYGRENTENEKCIDTRYDMSCNEAIWCDQEFMCCWNHGIDCPYPTLAHVLFLSLVAFRYNKLFHGTTLEKSINQDRRSPPTNIWQNVYHVNVGILILFGRIIFLISAASWKVVFSLRGPKISLFRSLDGERSFSIISTRIKN